MKTEKRSSPQIRGDKVSPHNMVSPQNGDTRDGPPLPPIRSDATVKGDIINYKALINSLKGPCIWNRLLFK